MSLVKSRALMLVAALLLAFGIVAAVPGLVGAQSNAYASVSASIGKTYTGGLGSSDSVVYSFYVSRTMDVKITVSTTAGTTYDDDYEQRLFVGSIYSSSNSWSGYSSSFRVSNYSGSSYASSANTGKVRLTKGTYTIEVEGDMWNTTSCYSIKFADVSTYVKSITAKNTSMYIGAYKYISYSYTSGAVSNFTFKSSKKSVCSVTSSGYLHAKKKGTAYITIKDTIKGKSKKVKVTVKAAKIYRSHSGKKKYFACDDYNTFYITSKASSPKVTWKSTNNKIASITWRSSDHKSVTVRGKRLGTCIVYAKSKNGNTVKWRIIVNKRTVNFFKGSKLSVSTYFSQVKTSKGTWSASKYKVAHHKGSKIVCTGHGKSVVTCKVKGYKYKLTVYSYSKKKMKAQAKKQLKTYLLNPSSLKIYSTGYTRSGQYLYVNFDYGSTNMYGAMVRGYRSFAFTDGQLAW